MNKQKTIGEALRQGVAAFTEAAIPSPRLEAEVLLASLLGLRRAGLLARLRDPLEEKTEQQWSRWLAERCCGRPLQYITGQQEFWGLDFAVTPDVLIPRGDTEVLVETALALLRDPATALPGSIVDVGTGSGAIAVALARELPDRTVLAIDRSEAALAVARANGRRHGVNGQITWLPGDLLQPVLDRGERPAMILSNPPYICTGDLAGLQREVVGFEPHLALDGGDDGLLCYRRLVPQAAALLLPGGWLVVEIGCDQGSDVAGLMRAQGFAGVRVIADMAGLDRVVVGQWHRREAK
ncbi:peptide chain release factor N(5)-glutamine methyltransferase [Heliophilum fasciatum]|uniref:Release factor glutamine methyltransferase n=1 Tax=Heliophilum fasciatum TaxID=35700 RepID=A0A4R2RQ53_9FIRM|nr:peptide chain release factor N(5)-glutamine methyltransferase [Heliophilum fasciatum]MCW2277491.1 release factor glutamine methyltransferase [Heliophilum fasciatum]TCP65218.1 [protein release factor]-glutamine N5-methyltransferase [Heliophilum fasciatum]